MSAAVTAALGTLWIIVALVLGALPVEDGSLETATMLLRAALFWLGLLGVPAVVVTLATWFIAATARAAVGAIEVGAGGIVIELATGHLLVPHEEVTEGEATPAGDRGWLRLARGDLLHVEDFQRPGEAEALLDAIAAGAPERALDLGVRRATRARTVAAIAAIPLCAALIAAASTTESVGSVVAMAALAGVAWTLFLTRFGAPKRLLAGHDGVALEGVRGQSFIPYRRIHGVFPSPQGIVLALDNTREIAVNLLPSAPLALSLSGRRRDRLIAKLEAELAAERTDGEELLGAAQLERGGRTIATWREGLRELIGRPTAGYRAASLDPEHLLRILETRTMAPERRLGAALALSSTQDPALRQRLRVFIDSSASDALRGALEQAAKGDLDEEVLEGALRQMDRA